MLYLIVLSVVLLVVVIFALQNAQAVTIRFLFWQLESSMAILALAFTAAGVLIAELAQVGEPPAALEARAPVTGPARPALPSGPAIARRG